jgi:diguanylate cyclase (GGDEF)-like protein
MLRHPALAVILLSLCLAAPLCAASPAFEAMLRQAEAVRSADPAQFQSLLGQLNASIDAATPEQQQQLQYLKAYHLAYTGRFDLGIAEAKKLFDEATDVTVKFRAGSLIVNGYAATREFTEGLRYLDQTLALLDQIDDPELRHHGWSAAGVIYNQVGQYELGRDFADLMLADNPSPRTRCFAGALRLEAMYNLGPLTGEDEAIRDLMQACIDVSEPVAANFARGQLARLWADKGDGARAIQMLTEKLPEIEATRYPRLIGEIHSLLAELNLSGGYTDEAEHHARKAIEQSHGIVHSLPLVTAYRVLYESALERGDTAAALDHYRRFAEADKAYLDNVKARELAFQLVKHETQQKSQTIELLNKQNEVLLLEQKIAMQNARNTQLLIALLAVLLASIGYWAYKTKKTQLTFRRLAETDALTGISNRHHFSRRAEAALEYCQRSGEHAALVMFDLDEFKAINDRHGHAMGDWVLQRVSDVCRATCRKNDLFGRLGGEEFAFLLIGADLAAGLQLAQECRERIGGIDTGSTGARFRVTASFGVAASADVGYDFHVLLARADEAMYRAKREGRDRISLHTPETIASGVTV